MSEISRVEAEQKARDFVATFESKQACWDYLKSPGVFWGKSEEMMATNDELAMEALIEEYLYGLDPSRAETHGYISKARMDRFTCYPGEGKFISKDEFDQFVRDGKAILYGKSKPDAGATS